MSDDEEVERFEISDYDLETEFNPNRYRKPISKNKHIYGIWAEESDEEESSNSMRLGFGASSSKSNSSAYPKQTGGVAFVSAGVQKPDKSGDQEDNEDAKDEDIPVTDSSSDDAYEFISKPPAKQGKKNRKTFDVAEMAGLRTRSGPGSKSLEMYGVGAKLAMKMGYQVGKGLGKDLQGISAPIVAQVRKGRGAIGAYGRERKTEVGETIDKVSTDTKDSEEVLTPKEHKWHKSSKGSRPTSNQTRIEYETLTANEVLERKQLKVRPDPGHLAKVKVIDLTGPEQRILSGYHAISGQQKPMDDWDSEEKRKNERNIRPSSFDMPELLHNIDILKDACEQDIFKNDRKERYARDRKRVLEEEKHVLEESLSSVDGEIERVESMLNTLKELSNPDTADLFTMLNVFEKIKAQNPSEWNIYQLYLLAPACSAILIKKKLGYWNPLKDPSAHVDLLTSWANLLGPRSREFEYILWESWMPQIRIAVQNWNVKDALALLSIMKNWERLMSAWIKANLLDQLLPRITEAVEVWDPLSDAIPIHDWIHPWIPYFGQRLEIVYPTIRRKFAHALTAWHPSDSSAKKIIEPWSRVFSQGAMESFLTKNIAPKLMQAFQDMVISPVNQSLDQWTWVMEWVDLLPINSMVSILESSFFPKWTSFLITWLNQVPNYEEVYKWYTWWRGNFSQVEALMKNQVVINNLQKTLEIIGIAIQHPGQVVDYSQILNRPLMQPQIAAAGPTLMTAPPAAIAQSIMADAVRMTAAVPQGFRDLVQMRCEELGIIFIPIPNRYYEAKQIYRCGSLNMYISGNVIYVQRDISTWVPVSLLQLLQMATGSG